jgi:hypothetical protein
MIDIYGAYENFIHGKSPMATIKLALYVNLFLTAASPQTGLLQHGNK